MRTRNLNDVFKYKSANDLNVFERDIKCLYENRIWFSKPEYLNDPYEGVVVNGLEQSEGYDLWQKSRNSYGIFSLSAVNDNLLLWTHYADNHRGYCIQYYLTDIYIGDFEVPAGNSLIGFDVEYNDKPRSFNDKSNMEFLFGSKSLGWRYEKEFRLVSNKCGTYITEQQSVKAIYLGANCGFIASSLLEKFCLDENVALFKAKIEKDQYKVTFHKILN